MSLFGFFNRFGGSRSTPSKDSLKAWYKLYLKADVAGHKKSKDLLSEKSVVKAFVKHNVILEPLHCLDERRPVLTIYEAYDHDELDNLEKKSNVQPLNELMVIITSVPLLENTDRLVLLKWDKSKPSILDHRNSIARIHSFVRDGWKRRPIQAPTSCYDPVPTPEHRQDADSDRTWREEAGDATSEAGQGTTERGAVHYALDQEVAEELLEKAVAFVAEVGEIRMVRVQEDFGRFSPLLVFCKNDTKLQEDIDNATRKTRVGADVMLIVVTDKKHQVLADTEATKAFGQKVCLYWSHVKNKFRNSEHRETMVWIRDFLLKYKIKSSLKRTDSMNRSLRKKFWGESTGFYHVLMPGAIQEEWIKKIVSFFHERLIELKKSISRPLVLLTVDEDDLEKNVLKFLRYHRLETRDVHVVVIHRGDNLREFNDVPGLTFLGLRMHDVQPEVLDIYINKHLVGTLKNFLKNFKPPKEDRDERGTTTATTPPPEDRGTAWSGEQQPGAGLLVADGNGADEEMDGGDGKYDRNRTAESMDGLEHGEANCFARSQIPAPADTNIDNPETDAQRPESQTGNRVVRTAEEHAIYRQSDRSSRRTQNEHPPPQHLNSHHRPGHENSSPQNEHPSPQHLNPQYHHNNRDPRTHPENSPPHHHHPHHHPSQDGRRTDYENRRPTRHPDDWRRAERLETNMDLEDGDSGRGSDLSQQPAARRHGRNHNTCPRNFDYRSENYERTPNQPLSQRKRDRRQRPTILSGEPYAQDGATLPTRAGTKRSAKETLDDLINAMGAVSIAGKEKKEDSSSLSNFHDAPQKEIPRSKRTARRRTHNR